MQNELEWVEQLLELMEKKNLSELDIEAASLKLSVKRPVKSALLEYPDPRSAVEFSDGPTEDEILTGSTTEELRREAGVNG